MKVFLSLSSFGATQVRSRGQAHFASIGREAGADGIEVRGELFVDPETEIPLIIEATRGLTRVYSHPETLYAEDGLLRTSELRSGLAMAQALGASRLKVSLGSAAGASASSLLAIRDLVSDAQPRGAHLDLLIENDQSIEGGTIGALIRFFALAERAGIDIGMTFDIGNWHWAGECPLAAAHALASRVRYVHCKGVQRLAHGWAAVPLAESVAPWRMILRALPVNLPWAIEYPLVGDDLPATARREIALVKNTSECEA